MEIFLCIFCCLLVLLLPPCLCCFLFRSVKRGSHSCLESNKRHCYTLACYMDIIMQSLTERLRPLVGLKGWDYCVFWKLSEDQRYIEWMNCCCAGTENTQNDGDEGLLFPVSPALSCRDTMFHHPIANSCDLLSQLPTSMPLDSGIYAETLVSNQPRWLNSSSVTCSYDHEESFGTRVLIPLAGGLIELFVNRQISEDQNVIDFITAQCNISIEQDTLLNTNNMDTGFCVNINAISEIQSRPFLGDKIDKMDTNNHLPPSVSPAILSYSITVDQTHPCSSPMNLQQAFFRSSHGPSLPSDKQMDSSEEAVQISVMSDTANMNMHFMEPITANKEQHGNEKDSNKEDRGRSSSLSDCSDQFDDEEDRKYRRKSGKEPPCKNLVAERKRRKKLNERLYTLRSLVPNISKLDKASILGDAIEYVKDLQRQTKELQAELEEGSNNDGLKNTGINDKRSVSSAILSRGEISFGSKTEHNKTPNEFHSETSGNGNISKQNKDSDTTNDKAPQMEPRVEVVQIDGNEFYVKVFCEHEPGRFVRLMEALNSLELEVTNANVTTFRNLVSNVLKVEKESKKVVQADQLRDFLLELTRNPSRGLSEIPKA